jgi:DNA-binding LytR/AlgR family response regulator
MKKEDSREYRVMLTNGKVVYFTLRELQGFLRSQNVLFLLVILLGVMVWGEAQTSDGAAGYAVRALYWAASICLYMLLLPLWIAVSSHLWAKLTSTALPLIFATGPLVFALTLFGSWFPAIPGHLAPVQGENLLGSTFLKNLVAAHLAEMTAFLWLYPQFQLARLREKTSASVRFVRLNGRSLPVDSLKLVRNEEHYLIINTTMGTVRLRARMKDLLAQVALSDGIQSHRSYWVARQEVVELRGRELITQSGTKIPVSRYRLKAVQAWVSVLGKPH